MLTNSLKFAHASHLFKVFFIISYDLAITSHCTFGILSASYLVSLNHSPWTHFNWFIWQRAQRHLVGTWNAMFYTSGYSFEVVDPSNLKFVQESLKELVFGHMFSSDFWCTSPPRLSPSTSKSHKTSRMRTLIVSTIAFFSIFRPLSLF